MTSTFPILTAVLSGERKATDTNFAASRPAVMVLRAGASRTGMAAVFHASLHYGAAAFAVVLPSRTARALLLPSPSNTDARHADRAKAARLFFLLTLNGQVRRA